MKLKNFTDFEEDTLREVIRFVKPPGVSKFDISFKNKKDGYFRGMAYADGCFEFHGNKNPLVIVSIGKASRFPLKGGDKSRGGYLPTPDLYTKEEALVYVTAHELRHLWQKLHERGWRVWGARGQYSERDADAYAIKKLREWRRNQ